MVTDADRERARSCTVATHGARSFWERWCVAPDMARRTVVTSGASDATLAHLADGVSHFLRCRLLPGEFAHEAKLRLLSQV